MTDKKREIKFRVWDKEKKKFITTKPENSVEANVSLEFATGYLTRWNEYVLMQFTGLLDKNGKEIYEGDIVRHYKLNDHNKSEPIIGEITISPLQGVVGGNWPLSFDNRVEIIGNLYENPELMKD